MNKGNEACRFNNSGQAVYIKTLIAEGEHQQQDFKFEVSDARKIARSISAFANTSGGRLLVGVKDNGKIAGIDSDEEIYMAEAAAKVYCTPEPEIDMEAFAVEGKTVLIVTVHETDRKPVKVIGADGRKLAYVRRADENVLATPVHLRVWALDGQVKGECVTTGGLEEKIVRQLAISEMVDVAEISRLYCAPRRSVVRAMAKLVRFGLAKEVFVNHKFYWMSV